MVGVQPERGGATGGGGRDITLRGGKHQEQGRRKGQEDHLERREAPGGGEEDEARGHSESGGALE